MGNPKLLEKFREFCDAYKVVFAIDGIVEKFDIIKPVAPEQFTQGLKIRTWEDTKLVQLDLKRKLPVKDGDRIIVVGRDSKREENSVLPAVILILKDHSALFSRNLRSRTRAIIMLWSVPSIVFFGMLLVAPWIIPLFQSWALFIGSSVVIGSSLAEMIHTNYSQRPKLYHCDEKTWLVFTEEVASKFGVTLTV